MKVIVGLGNPGEEYAHHRHNLGFQIVDRYCANGKIKFRREGKSFMAAIGEWGRGKVMLVKPTNFMNVSGEALLEVRRTHPFAPEDLVVVHDDIDLALGKTRWVWARGSAGHNGVTSIVLSLGTNSFFRLRGGVGRPPPGILPADYVLEEFSVDEKAIVEEMVDRAAQSIGDFLKGGIQYVQQKYH